MRIKDRTLLVYLAGAMSNKTFAEMNEWRIEAIQKIQEQAFLANYNAIVINPVSFYNFEEKRHQTEAEVEDYDLALATNSDLIVVNLDGLNTSIGSIIELHDCNFHNKIPVIAFGSEEEYKQLHPWIYRDITRYESSIDDVAEYIHEFYMI